MGPERDGPFGVEHQGGCGWHRHVYLGVGVGKPGAVGAKAVPPPPTAGTCPRCGGPLSFDANSGFLPAEGFSEEEFEPSANDPMLMIPGRRVAGRMAHEGKFYAQLREPETSVIEDPGER